MPLRKKKFGNRDWMSLKEEIKKELHVNTKLFEAND
jgi:hypothetical protein